MRDVQREGGEGVSSYTAFLESKRLVVASTGKEPRNLHPALFPFQRALVEWAVRKGRAALWPDTGLGKTIQSLAWAEALQERTLILAPLAVAQQTVREGAKFGIPVRYARNESESAPYGITVTNYERLEGFDYSAYKAVVLDEAAILRNFTGVTKKRLIAAFRQTPYRLTLTATPAPNDTIELTNQADFLSVMAPSEMLSTFFIAKGKGGRAGEYRLKGHARGAFFRWLASWSMSVKQPSDLGFDDTGFILPKLTVIAAIVPVDWAPDGKLFSVGLNGVGEASQARRASLLPRVERAAEIITAEPNEQWLVYCGLNDEGRELGKRLPGATVLEGSADPEYKAAVLNAFAMGNERIVITKGSIAGLGMNFQSCARELFLGLSHSWEQYYQGIRRCWRFGQERPVNVHVVISDVESDVYNNVMRKEREAQELSRELVHQVRGFEREEITRAGGAADPYSPRSGIVLPAWLQAVEREDICRIS